jgi:hypothetical protein
MIPLSLPLLILTLLGISALIALPDCLRKQAGVSGEFVSPSIRKTQRIHG